MATGGLRTVSDDYYRCYKALNLVVHAAIPCVDHCLRGWHQQQRAILSHCTRQGFCPPLRKPKPSVSCQSCIGWGQAIEAASYHPYLPAKSTIIWTNVTSSNLYISHVEVAKAFVLRLSSKSNISRIEDLDSASLLMIMGKFAQFHAGDFATYDCIQRVSSVTTISIAYYIMLKVDHGKFIKFLLLCSGLYPESKLWDNDVGLPGWAARSPGGRK